jgi:WD40 repeat protein
LLFKVQKLNSLAADACLPLLNTQVRRLLTGELLHTLDHGGMFTSTVAVPGQCGLLVTGAEDGQVEVWNVVAGEHKPAFFFLNAHCTLGVRIRQLSPPHPRTVTSMAITPTQLVYVHGVKSATIINFDDS